MISWAMRELGLNRTVDGMNPVVVATKANKMVTESIITRRKKRFEILQYRTAANFSRHLPTSVCK